jgi:hypothetical protein
MSGGHYNYLCYTIEDTYEGELENTLLEEMFQDFCKLLKSLEWYKSGDTSQEDYQEDVQKFIEKWTNSDQAAYAKAKADIVKNLENFIKSI